MFTIKDIDFFGLSPMQDDNIFDQPSIRNQDFFAELSRGFPFPYLPSILRSPLLHIDLTMNNRQGGHLISFVMKFHY